ncbi:serine hydrolase domain-containing protein [Phenylobacterium sp.]|uniref:serine hydrolase domain-containing protein n=1 Tax=Phenylobacterium sp. TaxID=1871053 RepID=UPI002F3E5C47
MDLDRRASLAGLLSLAASPALAAAKTAKAAGGAKTPDHWAEIDATAKKLVADRAIPGVSIRVARRGTPLFVKGYGWEDIETGTPMSPAAVCRIGSITKQFTASVILQLAHEGKLSLDDNLAVYLPDFPNAQRLGLRRMLSHTSGLGNYTAVRPDLFLQASRTDRDTAQLVEAMKPTSEKLAYEPGTDWRYSNTAYVLLGVVIEKVTGMAYAKAMEARLFAPLGLRHTAVDDAAMVVPNRASGYSNDKKAESGFDNASYIAMSYPGGAGNIRSTTGDLCAWHAQLLGGKVLDPGSLKAMLTPVTLNDGKLPTTPDGKGGKADVHYGYGVSLDPHEGHPTVGHGGGIQGFASYIETFTDLGVTWVTLTNTDSPPRDWSHLQEAVRKAAATA